MHCRPAVAPPTPRARGPSLFGQMVSDMGKKRLARVKIGIIIGLSMILVLLVAQNSVPVLGRFLWFTGEISAVVLLILSATVGFILGLFVARRRGCERHERPLIVAPVPMGRSWSFTQCAPPHRRDALRRHRLSMVGS